MADEKRLSSVLEQLGAPGSPTHVKHASPSRPVDAPLAIAGALAMVAARRIEAGVSFRQVFYAADLDALDVQLSLGCADVQVREGLAPGSVVGEVRR